MSSFSFLGVLLEDPVSCPNCLGQSSSSIKDPISSLCNAEFVFKSVY